MALVFRKQQIVGTTRDAAMRGLVKAAQFLVRDIRKALNTPFPPASEEGEYPHKRTGNLRKEIDYWEDTSGMAVEVGASVDAQYWSDLEYGTKNMGPRPFVRPRADAMKSELEAIVGGEVKLSMGK